jgi:hypothetical protein
MFSLCRKQWLCIASRSRIRPSDTESESTVRTEQNKRNRLICSTGLLALFNGFQLAALETSLIWKAQKLSQKTSGDQSEYSACESLDAGEVQVVVAIY